MPSPHVHMLLERLGNLLREDLRAVAARHGLNLAQLEVLQYLAQANRFSDTLSAVTAFFGTTKGTASQSLSALQRKGFLERLDDPKDGRVQHCALTPLGKAAVEDSLPAPLLRRISNEVAGPALEALLSDLLQARGAATFGACRTCAHFRSNPQGYRCGLLDEELKTDDIELVCIDHTPPARVA